jgi:hypothetical protein|nr:MAG TPA: hypothetical protein [Caudoviricetes sp.]
MITINGKVFYDKPGSCGSCSFFFCGSTHLCPNRGKGICILFNEMHQPYINPPKRCQKLFNKAFRMPDGSDLVIVKNTED